jgi:hypothetical protein
MKFHLYRVSASIIPAQPSSPHPNPLEECDSHLTYDPHNPLPMVKATVYVPSDRTFRVQCKQDGDASDVGINDLAFDIFLDGVWVAGTCFKEKNSKTLPQNKPAVFFIFQKSDAH